jgi:hypothetical protein
VFSPLELECLICGDSEFPVDRMKEMFHFQNSAQGMNIPQQCEVNANLLWSLLKMWMIHV